MDKSLTDGSVDGTFDAIGLVVGYRDGSLNGPPFGCFDGINVVESGFIDGYKEGYLDSSWTDGCSDGNCDRIGVAIGNTTGDFD